jgi:acylphosphatase
MTSRADPQAHECWLVRVRGRVQGVGFREACVDQATFLGVTGWVRNRFDGSVETLLQGRVEQLARMRDWLWRGPPAARVEDLKLLKVEPPYPRFDRFERRRTE